MDVNDPKLPLSAAEVAQDVRSVVHQHYHPGGSVPGATIESSISPSTMVHYEDESSVAEAIAKRITSTQHMVLVPQDIDANTLIRDFPQGTLDPHSMAITIPTRGGSTGYEHELPVARHGLNY